MSDKESLTGKTVMVTGGAGFVGSHLCDKLAMKNPAKIIIVDDFSLGKESNLTKLRQNQSVLVLRADASNSERVKEILDRWNVDVVFNLAVVPLPASLTRPQETIEKNLLITTTLCELLRKKRYRTLVHCSSSEAYGSALYSPMDEHHPVEPLTPYAASKVACDYVVMSYFRTFGVDVAVARPFNTYGPRQNEGSYAGVIPATIRHIKMGGPPLVYGDGLQTRDYTYVEDIVDGILDIYQFASTRGRIVNLATGKEIRILDLVKLIMQLMKYEGEIVYGDPRPADVRRHCGDITLAKKLINYSPRTDFATGIGTTVEWYESVLRAPQ
jgi:UDP-glucose 4-epimerase